ncbi:Glycosyl transferases group 1 [compost metagenome]
MSEKDKNVLRLKLGIAVSGKVYFYSGSFNKRKNILSLLDKLVISDDDIFILAGGGHLFNECVEKYRNDDRYVFLGQLKSCKEYYQISDVCVSASLSEGLPLALIEAYCSGARLLVSSIPSHVELFELAKGVNIRLFDLDAPSICYEDFFYSSEKNVVENQIAFFSAQRMSEKYYKLYQELI